MEIVPLSPELRASWDQFCLQSPDAWFWHTTAWLDYNLAYRPELEQRNLSFLCKEGDRVMAIVPLILAQEIVDDRKRPVFSLSGNPLPSPALEAGLSEPRREKLFEIVFSVIEGLAVEFGVAYSRFQIDPLCPNQLEPRTAAHNHLLRHQYTDCSIGTQVIDLRRPENQLWGEVRRDHQRNIEKARTELRAQVFSGRELTNEKFDEYRQMHARAAGRITRPQATFDMMRDWIQTRGGFMTEARLPDGKPVGFETYQEYKGAVYSMSACNEPGFERLPIRHLVQWTSILWMKSRGVRFYDVGFQRFRALPYDCPDRKNLDISLFKGGFGGITLPVLRGERFRDRALWEAVKRRRDEIFAQRYDWTASSDQEEARALLLKFERLGTPSSPRPEEVLPIPEDIRALAAQTVSANPDAVQKHRNGSTKALAFLVGAAMSRAVKGTDPRFVRRALVECLSRVMDAERQT